MKYLPILLFCLPLPAGWGLDLYLNRTALVEGPVLRLGEVACVIASAQDRESDLEGIELGPAPERLTLLPVRSIREGIEPHLGEELILIGGRVGIIPADYIPREQAWFFGYLLEFLDVAEPDREGRLEVELISSPRLPLSFELQAAQPPSSNLQASLPPPVFTISARSERDRYLFGELEVSYRLKNGDEGSFRVLIHHYRPVAQAARSLEPDQALGKEDLVFTEREISGSPGSYLLDEEEAGGFRVATFIPAGRLLYRSQLEKHWDVKAGDTVTIRFIRPGLRIMVRGRALSSAVLGERIEVRTVDSRKSFLGRLVSGEEVEVEID